MTHKTEIVIDLGDLGEREAELSFSYTPGRLSGSRDLPDDQPEVRLRSLRHPFLSEEGQEELLSILESDQDLLNALIQEVEETALGLED